jgi:Flp pilus assembly protein protease CpaA
VALIFYYLGFMAAGDVAAYLPGSAVEYEWASQVSLVVFLALYFLFLWIAWLLAVWVTKPKSVEPATS